MAVTDIEHSSRKNPDFFVVGAPKCGTSAMNAYLGNHGDVFMAPKETHYFASDVRLHEMTEPEYLALFDNVGCAKRVGEASVWYLYSTEAAGRIRDFAPDARIVAMLRNPVDLLHSLHSQMLFEPGSEDKKSFEAAVNAEADRHHARALPPGLTIPPKLLYYREIVHFAPQLDRYFSRFGRERVRVILHDDFRADNEKVFAELCAFLEIEEQPQGETRVMNPNKRLRSRFLTRLLRHPHPVLRVAAKAVLPTSWRRSLANALWRRNISSEPREPLSPHTRRRLSSELEPVIDELSAVLNRDLSYWKSQ
jgi:hypothetical protein